MTAVPPEENWGLHVEWLLDYLLRNGVFCDEVSAVLGTQIVDPENVFLPIDDYLKLFNWSSKRLSAPHLGLDIADQMQSGTLGILGYLCRNTPTVDALCTTLERYQPIFMRGMGFGFKKTGRVFEIQWQIFQPTSEDVRQDVEFTLAGFLRVLKESLGDAVYPINTLFRHACREPAERYEQTFGSRVLLEQEENCLVFSADLLRMPLSDSDPKLLSILKQQDDSLLLAWEGRKSLVRQARFFVATSLETEHAGADTLARELHITTRTLNRQLRREGTNYQQLREEVIAELAKRSLAESEAPITAIGNKLGYSESSSFVRAFKKMTGTTPLVYRKKSRSGGKK